ncbi:hypothetical protein BI364_15415 [Acidihalobacter yilgarnensis]|uniref:Sigma-54 factor interaction domain-containing protein n=1 Tax=Acidihalobacter yilgarnensis TaxID=2819280 RepID=A0A1D8IRH4_9GAMM|nr:sigma 54-interacting transcriptional regulator [Acidihalobacter yilgarnensis]AOU99138.1 hypothetical protein BI364_15415 [Acidihalobacter yilgarnensis]
MSASHPSPLNPVAFLQAFIVQSIKVAGQLGSLEARDRLRYIEHLGLAAASCLESAGREQQSLDADAPLDQDRYASLIVEIKNQIGGKFSRTSSAPGYVSVVNHVCPFGDAVMQAPELCRMTSSVFGAIGARNFGYAKVHLHKRIATGDGCCEARIFVEPALAQGQPGDEYQSRDGTVSSSLVGGEDPELQRKLSDTWCANRKTTKHTAPAIHMVAESPAMRAALRVARVVAPTDASVLITGETGVGKEIIARTIHALGKRHDKPFVTINCGAIPEGLVETELFGHERGAFTGAYDVHHGYFERADGGTLFLDEINSLPLAVQVKLLRVLQEGTFERVGGSQTLAADVRILAATNQDMTGLLREGGFRHDLYYRLNVVPIDIPPLRRRIDDLSALANHILRRLSEKYGVAEKILGSEAWHQLVSHDWPGNIRELENLLERAFLFTEGPLIEHVLELPGGTSAGAPADGVNLRALKHQAASAAERRAIQDSLQRYRGQIRAVARELGVTTRAVHQKLKSHGIKPAEYRHPVAR